MKAKKNMFSRLLAFCLALALTVAMGTSAFAAPITAAGQTGSITIQGIETDAGLPLNIYKIIDVNMDETSAQPKEPVYTWNADVAEWVRTNYETYIGASNSVTEAFSKATAQDLTAFYGAMAAAIADGTITIENAYPGTSLSEATYNVTLSNVSMGQYLIVPHSEGASTYAPATATLFPKWNGEKNCWELDDAAVSIKGSPDDTRKEIVGGDASVSIGDVIHYEVNALIPSYPSDATAKRFVIGDTMTAGLTFKNDDIKVSFDKAGKQEVPTDCYTVAAPGAEGETFTVTFNYDNLKNAANGATRVYLTYSATVNENAFDQDALGNSVYTGVNNNPYDDGSYDKKPGPETKAYTYGIIVTKVGNENAPLSGAEFKLYSDADCTQEIKFVGSNGVYTKATAEQEDSAVAALVTAADGTLKLQGLGDGTYYLKETKAPGGYNLPQNPVTTIVLTDDTGAPDGKSDGVLDAYDTNTQKGSTATGTTIAGSAEIKGKNLSMTLINTTTGFELPVTGGMGTIMFTAVGVVLMAGGVLLVVLNLKRRKAAK